MNALHNEKPPTLCQQDYAIWNAALKQCSTDPVVKIYVTNSTHQHRLNINILALLKADLLQTHREV